MIKDGGVVKSCRWRTKRVLGESKPEYCGKPTMEGKDYCPKHQKLADSWWGKYGDER